MKRIMYFIVLLLLIVLPLGVEFLIKNGILGLKFPETIFTQDQWFAFWGSYLGSIITVIVLFITIRYNKIESQKMFLDYKIEQKYDVLLRDLKEIHTYINLCDSNESEMDRNYIVYAVRLSAKRYYELMNGCEQGLSEITSEYIPLVKQIWSEYILEIDKVPKSLQEIDIKDAAEIYKATTKKLFEIKHSYVDKENLMYDNVVKEIYKKRLEEKKKNFLL